MTDQTRAAFEAHFQLTQRQAWQHKDGSYQFPEIQAKWEGYLAGVAKAAPGAVQERGQRQCRECLRLYGTHDNNCSAAAAPGAVPDDAKDAAPECNCGVVCRVNRNDGTACRLYRLAFKDLLG